jgi:hypothetical protein
MPKYEVIYLKDKHKNYTYFNNKISAYDFAIKNKPSVVLLNFKRVKEFK